MSLEEESERSLEADDEGKAAHKQDLPSETHSGIRARREKFAGRAVW